MALFLILLLKSLFVFVLAGIVLLALRRASAAARHLVCLLTLGAILVLPLVSTALPGWRIAGLQVRAGSQEPTPQQVVTLAQLHQTPKQEGEELQEKRAIAPTVPNTSSSSSRFGRTPAKSLVTKQEGGFWLLALYFFGILLAALRPLLGLWGISSLRRRCVAADDAPTVTVFAHCAELLNLQTPRLYRAEVCVPMTWGWRRPVVLLPLTSVGWPEDRLRSVLLHEMAHIKRRDWPGHRFADLVCAVFWFHPLVWLTARRLRSESELACDDLVLASGIAAPDYARHLLEIAGTLSRVPASPHSAVAMAQTSQIEGRIRMVLDKTRTRRTLTRRVLLAALIPGTAALVTLGILRPDAKAQVEPLKPQRAVVLAESEAMQRERQYALENSRLLRGEHVTPQGAAEQQRRLAVQPDDYAAHLCLLGYDLNCWLLGTASTSTKLAYRQEVFWLIQHHPESLLFSRESLFVPRYYAPALFDGDKTLWQAQFAKYPSSAVIFGNAAEYYLLSDKAAAEMYLLQAQALEPKNPIWPEDLGQIYFLHSHHVSVQESQILAQKSRDEYQLSASLAKKIPQP